MSWVGCTTCFVLEDFCQCPQVICQQLKVSESKILQSDILHCRNPRSEKYITLKLHEQANILMYHMEHHGRHRPPKKRSLVKDTPLLFIRDADTPNSTG